MKSVKIVRVGDVAGAYQPTTEQFQGLIARALEKRTEAAASLRRESERLIASKWPAAELVNDSALRMQMAVEGFGPTPKPGDTISVHFTFELIDGTQIDDTRARGEPYSFILGEERLIPGLELAIGRIREGGSATAIIPPELAFGPAGIPPVVEPNSFVVFRIDVVSVE